MQIEVQEAAAFVGDRRSERLDSQVKHIVLSGENGEKWIGSVTDESLGGIGLQFDQVVPLCEGQELELVLDGIRMLAQIRHFSPTEDSGCRVGVEWNAHCLAERARSALQPLHAQCPDEATRQFLELVPGGVYMLWRNFESHDWPSMVITAKRLANSAADCGIQSLQSLAEKLVATVDASDPEQSVRAVVHDFVRECISLSQQ